MATDELRIGPRQAIRDGEAFNFAALSMDGCWVAAADLGAAAVSIFDLGNPTNYFRLVSHPEIQFPAISPNGRWVAAGNFKGSGVKSMGVRIEASRLHAAGIFFRYGGL